MEHHQSTSGAHLVRALSALTLNRTACQQEAAASESAKAPYSVSLTVLLSPFRSAYPLPGLLTAAATAENSAIPASYPRYVGSSHPPEEGEDLFAPWVVLEPLQVETQSTDKKGGSHAEIPHQGVLHA